MPAHSNLPPLRKSLSVNRGAAEAFSFFTRQAGKWWPLDSHKLANTAAGEKAVDATFEPRAGGRIYETLSDGRQLDWGGVLAFEEGKRLAVRWELGKGRALATEWEVTFTETASGRTRVDLEHRGWEALGEAGAAMRGNYDKGWDFVLGQRYAGLCNA